MASNGEFGLDVGIYGPLATPETILNLARLAEEMEFSALWLADHVAFPVQFASKYPYSVGGAFPTRLAEPLFEPIATLGVLAGATRKLKLGTAVLVMPYRNPVLLARMLITLDNFSGGRIVLGAGTGWLAEEFSVLGSDEFARRGKATDEYLEIFKALSAGGEVGYQGETYAFPPVFSMPGSVQRPHPPIMIGGVADVALRRAVKHGNGWLAVTMGTDKLPERLATLKRFCAEAGRDFGELQLAYKMFLDIDRPKRSRFGEREPGSGSIGQIVDDLKTLRDLGFGHFVVRYRGEGADEQMRQIARFAEEIVPKV